MPLSYRVALWFGAHFMPGVKPTGEAAPGLFNNLNGAKQFKTLALNTYQALQPLAAATP